MIRVRMAAEALEEWAAQPHSTLEDMLCLGDSNEYRAKWGMKRRGAPRAPNPKAPTPPPAAANEPEEEQEDEEIEVEPPSDDSDEGTIYTEDTEDTSNNSDMSDFDPVNNVIAPF